MLLLCTIERKNAFTYIDNLRYKIIRNENIFEIFQIVVLNVFRNVNITIQSRLKASQ